MLPPPIQMCDALSRNLPGELQTILANCLAHGRRQFVECGGAVSRGVPARAGVAVRWSTATTRWPESGIYRPQQRLLFHQAESGPIMEELHVWLVRQFDERRVEPNSGLGKAIAYLLRHWEKLTLFLRVPGAPLDNNICERALKKAILHRKNALFYKTCHGAHVGDVFMSLIYTCELCGANPFDYLDRTGSPRERGMRRTRRVGCPGTTGKRSRSYVRSRLLTLAGQACPSSRRILAVPKGLAVA